MTSSGYLWTDFIHGSGVFTVYIGQLNVDLPGTLTVVVFAGYFVSFVFV